MGIFQSTLKIIFRNLIRNKLYSTINIIGLSVGLVVFILIFLFIRYEYSWDSFNTNYKNIYIVKREKIEHGEVDYSSSTPFALSEHLRTNFPEIINSVSTKSIGDWYLSSSNENMFSNETGIFAESNLFEIFSISILDGNADIISNNPKSILISKSLALKLFPNENSIGKLITINKKYKLEVVGIYNDLPDNSHFKPSYILPFSVLENIENRELLNNWESNSFKTYVLLVPHAEKNEINKKIINVLNDRITYKKQYIKLSHISNIYLNPDDKDYIYALYAYRFIAIFILILASINYINLATIGTQNRIKEIGIKKIIGCRRTLLVKQHLGESVFFSIISVLLALVISRLLLPYFNTLIKRNLVFNLSDTLGYIILVIVFALIVGIISGIYPALVVTGYKPIKIIKNQVLINIKGKIGFRRFLVGFQFVIFLTLITTSLVIKKQIDFMKNKDLGFDATNIITTPIRTDNSQTIDNIKTRLSQIPEIKNMCVSKSPPFIRQDYREICIDDNQPDEKLFVATNYTDIDFIDTYGLKIISGRNFNKNNSTDYQTCLINESLANKMGMVNPIGKSLDNGRYEIIGVMKDFHQSSVHNKIEPYMIIPMKGAVKGWNIYSIKVISEIDNGVMAKINNTFNEIFPSDPFEFEVFEDKLYSDEAFEIWTGIGNAMTFFTIFAIFIAVIGLFGLVSFTSSRRTKEIGIRKSLGSSHLRIYFLLSKEFINLFLVAIMIAIPLSFIFYKTMPGAYKYNIGIVDFIIPIGLGLFITLFSTINQTLKATYTNPVDALRYE